MGSSDLIRKVFFLPGPELTEKELLPQPLGLQKAEQQGSRNCKTLHTRHTGGPDEKRAGGHTSEPLRTANISFFST